MWTDLYIAEGKRQLTQEQFYDKIPSAATQSSQQETKTFINTATESKQLSPSATNLIVEHQCQRTSNCTHYPRSTSLVILVVSTCSCPTELLAIYLDHLTAPFAQCLDSYVEDTTHMLNILDSFWFRGGDRERWIFTMDIKSLYMVIPNHGGLRALQYYLNKEEIVEPPIDT